ncbi:Marinostatin-L [Clarias magur]|uniref:Marinostatin-L n=1 Tax=Clarias magur TaxID=1594786 RepID=A0A8J4X6B3_CLAMG|nr:Marinostatin-L [Clarias magur]
MQKGIPSRLPQPTSGSSPIQQILDSLVGTGRYHQDKDVDGGPVKCKRLYTVILICKVIRAWVIF